MPKDFILHLPETTTGLNRKKQDRKYMCPTAAKQWPRNIIYEGNPKRQKLDPWAYCRNEQLLFSARIAYLLGPPSARSKQKLLIVLKHHAKSRVYRPAT